jgi:predicted lactoylglutathione lyase
VHREIQDKVFMYSTGISDLDGLIWKIGRMHMEAFLKSKTNQQL